MKLIDGIKAKGGTITSFKSYTGGLIAPESDNNPWQYKITWNPRNVVLAGQGTAKYLERGNYKYIPYQQLFTRTETLEVARHGEFEGYANRDSLSYRKAYGLENIPTLLRGTLRRPGYCSAWNVLVQLGPTDDTYHLENPGRCRTGSLPKPMCQPESSRWKSAWLIMPAAKPSATPWSACVSWDYSTKSR